MLKALRQEHARRSARQWDARSLLYPDQLAVYDDTTDDRVLVGTRQLGKSWLAAVLTADVGVQQPGTNTVFLDMDIEHAEKIILDDWQTLIDEHGLPARITDGVLHLENGSKGYVFSGRANEIKKLQGLKPALLVVDEAQDAPDLHGIIKMVRPGLMRFAGRILCMGIPGYVDGVGDWWDITEGTKRGVWGQHRGHMDRNPFLPEASRLEQRAKALIDLGGEDAPEFVRHWKGQWPSLDNSLRVFRYFPELNGYDGEPPQFRIYGLGLDPGGTLDAEALVVVGHGNGVRVDGRWHPDGAIYVVDEDETDKGAGGSWEDTGDRVSPLVARWKPADAFYDYGSARKDGLAVILDADKRLSFKAVPAKDVEQEVRRINQLFAAKKLWVKRGSKLDTVLRVSMWDPKARVLGKSVIAKGRLKQNLGDALRAALWACESFARPPDPPLPPHEERQRRIRAEIAAAQAAAGAEDYNALVGDAMR